MLLAILSDPESELGVSMRQQCPNLQILLPSVISIMSVAEQEGQLGIQGVINEAQLMAARENRHELKPEDFFLACVRGTTDSVRAVLTDLGLNPFRQEDLRDED